MGSSRLIISYLTLRKVVGILGTSLPFILFFGAMLFFGTGGQSSISSYYHTDMRDVFVATLCVIGFFLFSYRGYEPADNIAGNLACVFAVGAALFPTAPDPIANQTQVVVGYMHLAFAGLFFAALIYFCLFLFTKTGDAAPTKQKIYRNRVYRICGYIMMGCIAGIALFYLWPNGIANTIAQLDPVFWLEGIAVVAFGISWLIKGEAILSDKAES